MPQMGYDMQEGTLVRWLKDEGADVAVGDPVAEIETDKAVVEFESVAAGVLRKILVSEGTTVPVGQVVAIVGEADEEISDVEVTAPPTAETTAAEPAAQEPAAVPTAVPASSAEVPAAQAGVRASPIARRLAAEKGIDLTQVTGTGPGNRITRDDVLSYEESHPTAAAAPAPAAGAPATAPTPAPAPAPTVAPATPGAGEKVPLTRMRQQIARVTVKSKQETPHFYVSAEIDMTAAMALRSQLNKDFEEEGVRISVNDLMLKSCIGALKKYPKFNAYFDGDGIQMHEAINIGIAIAEEEGLIVPAVMNSGGMSLMELARASKDLADRAQSGTLHPQEYTGGTFSTSNLGMFDVTSFSAIILPPQAAVLAVGIVAKRPVVRDDEIVVAQTMTATISVDHRVADGAEGARFLVEVKRLLEHPALLLV